MKIIIASLKHSTAGRHSSFMPLATGLVASYAIAAIGRDNLDIRLTEESKELEDAIKTWRPDIVAFSHYSWNAEIHYLFMRHIKQTRPETIIIAGGPEVPDPDWKDENHQFLLNHLEIDFFIYGEGEKPFADLVGRIIDGNSVTELKGTIIPGVESIHPISQELVMGERPPRLDLNDIPSPFTSGLMDHWFDGEHVPMVQLARGCPYKCAFCDAAQSWYSRVQQRSMEHIKNELEYIAERMKPYPNIMLAITDSNFGQYKHDLEVADYLKQLQDEWSWPKAYDVTTGKSQHQRILETSDKMENRFQIYSSTQSFNPETLKIIERRNLPMDDFLEVLEEIKKRGMETAADYIIPMPMETKDSFLNGMKIYIENDIDLIVPLTLVMLKGVPLSSRENREKYAMETRWRLVSRSIGEYVGEKCFEVEEVCVATNTMSFEDYLDCRGFSFVTVLFQDPQYDIVVRHLKELGISRFDFTMKAWETIRSGKSSISEIYFEFMRQTEGELFSSREEIYEIFSVEENYQKLLSGEEGDNLLRRFRALVMIDKAPEALALSYDIIESLSSKEVPGEQIEALRDSCRWAMAVRNVSLAFSNTREVDGDSVVELYYDVAAWYNDKGGEPLTSYRTQSNCPARYRISADRERIKEMLDAGSRMYGRDIYLSIPRLLLYYDIRNFWFSCERIDEDESPEGPLRPTKTALDWKQENWLS